MSSLSNQKKTHIFPAGYNNTKVLENHPRLQSNLIDSNNPTKLDPTTLTHHQRNNASSNNSSQFNRNHNNSNNRYPPQIVVKGQPVPIYDPYLNETVVQSWDEQSSADSRRFTERRTKKTVRFDGQDSDDWSQYESDRQGSQDSATKDSGIDTCSTFTSSEDSNRGDGPKVHK